MCACNSLVFTESFAQSLGAALIFLWIKWNPVAILQHITAIVITYQQMYAAQPLRPFLSRSGQNDGAVWVTTVSIRVSVIPYWTHALNIIVSNACKQLFSLLFSHNQVLTEYVLQQSQGTFKVLIIEVAHFLKAVAWTEFTLYPRDRIASRF